MHPHLPHPTEAGGELGWGVGDGGGCAVRVVGEGWGGENLGGGGNGNCLVGMFVSISLVVATFAQNV